MDQSVEQSLSARPCGACGASTYEANLACHQCKAVLPACGVTGYPVAPGESVPSRGDASVVSRRDDWNEWVARFGVCPVSGAPAAPAY